MFSLLKTLKKAIQREISGLFLIWKSPSVKIIYYSFDLNENPFLGLQLFDYLNQNLIWHFGYQKLSLLF